jgi:imidazolonepropionase-like amidohydrolase
MNRLLNRLTHQALNLRMTRSFPTFLLILSAAAGLNALAPTRKEEASKSTIIKAGRLFDSEKGIFLDNQYITVLKNRVVSVDASIKNPKDEAIIDLGKYTVLPGLIDCHTHLLFLEKIGGQGSGSSAEMVASLVFEGDALRALHGAARAKTFLEAGVTTVQDLGNSGKFADIALRQAIEDGSVAGCRMRVSGPGLSAEGGQIPGLIYRHLPLLNDEYRIVRGVDDAVAAVRENLVMRVDLIKIYADNAPNIARLSVEEMAVIVQEAHRYGLRVTAHAEFDQSIRDAALAGVDSIEHAYSLSDETIQLLKEKNIIVVPTLMSSDSFARYLEMSGETDRDVIAKQLQSIQKRSQDVLQRLMKSGVPIASGSDEYLDFNMPQGQAAKKVLYAYAEYGMGVLEILKTTSINAAKQLRLENSIGVIKKGSFADIIAVEGNLEKDIRVLDNIRFVMKDGKIYVNTDKRVPSAGPPFS